MTNLIGALLGLMIGGSCRYFDIPLPAPSKFAGALLVFAMTLGYLVGGSLSAAS